MINKKGISENTMSKISTNATMKHALSVKDLLKSLPTKPQTAAKFIKNKNLDFERINNNIEKGVVLFEDGLHFKGLKLLKESKFNLK